MRFNSSLLAFAALSLLASCQDGGVGGDSTSPNNVSASELPTWVKHIDHDTMIGSPKVVSCTLSGGAKTQCVSFTLKPKPESFEIGPWCPRNISDGSDVSGIWLNDGEVHDADGPFIQNLAEFYDDKTWQLFDPETGEINVTDTKLSCEAAARPDVDPEYQNHCVECQISYLPDGITMTYFIPLQPEAAQTISPRIDHAGVGIAFSGARLDASAPLEAILSAYTIAAFDDCGGHINPNVGYHIHAVTDADCLTGVKVDNDHAFQIGVAMDGYALHSRFNLDGTEPLGLDTCRGHATENLAYHYHVNDPGKNAILECHTGQTGCALSEDSTCDASQSVRRGPPRGNGPPPRRQ